MKKAKKKLNIAINYLDTIEHRNLKLTTVVVCDEGFLKMLSMITSGKGQRS